MSWAGKSTGFTVRLLFCKYGLPQLVIHACGWYTNHESRVRAEHSISYCQQWKQEALRMKTWPHPHSLTKLFPCSSWSCVTNVTVWDMYSYSEPLHHTCVYSSLHTGESYVRAKKQQYTQKDGQATAHLPLLPLSTYRNRLCLSGTEVSCWRSWQRMTMKLAYWDIRGVSLSAVCPPQDKCGWIWQIFRIIGDISREPGKLRWCPKLPRMSEYVILTFSKSIFFN